MSYTIRYETQRGGSGMATLPTNEDVKKELLKLFKQGLEARVEKDGIVIGEVYKSTGGRWQWYLDTDA